MDGAKIKMPTRRKVIIIIAAVLASIIALLLIAFAIFSYLNKGSADDYTLEQHIERISQLVEKRYFSDLSEYTGYELYPIYDEKDELRYFLIELQPVGFVYVRLNKKYSKILNPSGMYTRCEGESWMRYRIWPEGVVFDDDGKYKFNRLYPEGGWSYKEGSMDYTHYYEVDNNGDFVVNECSHFKAADIADEKRYILICNNTYVPAIKRDGKYINLVSMEELFSYGDEYPGIHLSFINKAHFNL